MNFKRRATRTTEDLANDFGQLVEEGRAVLSEMLDKRQDTSSNVRGLFDDISDKLANMQSSATQAAMERAREGAKYARQADKYLRDNPWPFVAGGIIAGVLATLWWSQRRY
jgi:ElaB/YqjD/DUF883 family membrane-anchored ribosome-binding protein